MFKNKEALFEKLRVNELPALPHVLNEILESCKSESAGMEELGKIIRHDAVLTAKLIATANSASYLQKQQVTITGIDRALLLIGTEHTKTIAVTAAVQQFLSAFNSDQTDYLKTFWTVSLRCALLAHSMARLTHYRQPEQAYLTGLLHNIGELALRSNFPSEYKRIDCPQPDEEVSLISRESKLIRANHCEFGAWLFERWSMGGFASAAIKHHHEPLQMVLDAQHLVKIIYVASHLADLDEKSNQAGFEAAYQLFGLSNNLTEDVNNKIREEVFNIATALQIELATQPDDVERIQQQDEKRHRKLARHVRDFGLINSTTEHMKATKTLTDIGRAIEESSFMLFGFTAARLFLIDEETNTLRYTDFSNPNQLANEENSIQLEVPLDQARSIMASSIITNKVVASAQWQADNGALPVIDQHVLSLLKTSQMICVPMQKPKSEHSSFKHRGLLAFGTHRSFNSSTQFSNMLRVFAFNAGNRFQQVKEEINSSNRAMTPEEEQLRLREINHEISNPLTIISNYLEILSGRLAKEPQANKELSIIREEIDRVGDILIKLGDNKATADDIPGTDINREIQDIVKLFSASLFLTHDIQCHTDIDSNLKPQAVPRSYIKQILINLIKNAVEAISQDGELEISTNHHVNVNGKRYAELIVRDNGPGIDSNLIPMIFESGHTTKNESYSGLGLGITKTLVDELKGLISCRNNSQGAEFQILLPARDLVEEKLNNPPLQAPIDGKP